MGIEIFASRIKQLREEAGLTTRLLGEQLGISHSSIIYYENCKREPTLSIIESYARRFNVTLDYLVGLTNERR